MVRRNDVVIDVKPEIFRFYGRVNRFVDKDHVQVFTCGRHILIYHVDDIEVVDYKGHVNPVTGRFNRMPTLRRLKQAALKYNDSGEVWRRDRRRPRRPRWLSDIEE